MAVNIKDLYGDFPFKSFKFTAIWGLVIIIPHVFLINPFAPGDFAEKRALKLVEWFSGHCRAIKS